MKIKNLLETCGACPSQWEANTLDGRGVCMFVIGGGYLSISISTEPGQCGVKGPEVYGCQIGEGFDGVISWSEVAPIIEGLNINLL